MKVDIKPKEIVSNLQVIQKDLQRGIGAIRLAKQLGEAYRDDAEEIVDTANDVGTILAGRKSHTSAEKWAHRAFVLGTTLVPAAKGAKLAGKSAKLAVRTAGLTQTSRDAKRVAYRHDIRQLKYEKQDLKRAKQIITPVKAVEATYYTQPWRKPTEEEQMARARMTTRVKNGYKAAKQTPEFKGAATAGAKSLKKMKDRPMNKGDFQVLGQNLAYGILKSYVPKKKTLNMFQKINDPSWYLKNGANMVGLNFGDVDKSGAITGYIANAAENINPKFRMNTDAIVELILTVPITDRASFAVAAARIGEEMRLHSGANTIYTPQDIQMYLLQARKIMAKICTLRRAIIALNMADPYDADQFIRYVLMALGADDVSRAGLYQELRTNSATILTNLNQMLKQIRAQIPINIPLMRRTEWLLTNYFADAPTAKHSTKCFLVRNFTSYQFGTDADGSQIIVGTAETGIGGGVMAFMNSISADIGTFVTNQKNMAISGDLMKVYGQDAFWAPSLITGTEEIPVVYDENALTQIQNSTVVDLTGYLDPSTYQEVVKADGSTGSSAVFIPTMTYSLSDRKKVFYAGYDRKVVNSFKDKVNAGDTLELTRLTSTWQIAEESMDEGGTQIKVGCKSCGTEVVTNYIWTKDLMFSFSGTAITAYLVPGAYSDHFLSGISVQERATLWAIDDWAPFMVVGFDNSTQTLYALFDVSNWARIFTPQEMSFHHIAGASLLTPEGAVTPTIS